MRQTEAVTSSPRQDTPGTILAGWISRGELARELDDAGRARMADGMERRRRGERGERGQARRDGG